MIYVVTGYPRSGTSAMMQALQAGGMPICFHPWRERTMQKKTGQSVLEVSPSQWKRLGFTAEVPDGYAVKIMLDCIHKLAARATTVIWMRRDPLQIKASVERLFGGIEQVKEPGWPQWLKALEDCQRGILQDRRSVTLHEVWYPDLLSDPFNVLVNLNVPVNASQAVSAIRPELRRYG